MRKVYSIILVLFLLRFSAYSQEIEVGEPERLAIRTKQWDIYGMLHTNGVGVGFRIGKEPSIHIRRGFDFEYTYYRHFKERRKRLDHSQVIVYGKLNYFGEFRGGYGVTHVLNQKPYWGGIEVGYFFYGGLTMGLSVPVYVKMFNGVDNVSVRYDPNLPLMGDIKQEPFGKGFKEIKVHPGIYVKTGMSFDFAKNDALVLKLDFGIAADAFYSPVEKIAFSTKQYVLLTGFICIHFGKRLANYE